MVGGQHSGLVLCRQPKLEQRVRDLAAGSVGLVEAPALFAHYESDRQWIDGASAVKEVSNGHECARFSAVKRRSGVWLAVYACNGRWQVQFDLPGLFEWKQGFNGGAHFGAGHSGSIAIVLGGQGGKH